MKGWGCPVVYRAMGIHKGRGHVCARPTDPAADASHTSSSQSPALLHHYSLSIFYPIPLLKILTLERDAVSSTNGNQFHML